MSAMNNMKLVETKNCPVCGGVERVASDGMARMRLKGPPLEGLHYLKHVAATLGVSVDELVERVNTYRCLSCGNYFCDPWFSPELASSLFCADAPDHLFAWGGFENWLHRRPPVQTLNERLYTMVTRKIGPISSYAEFGCPFQGFLIEWKGHEAAPSERISSFARALYREPDVRWSKITRLYNAGQRWCGRLAVFSLRIRGALVRLATLKEELNKGGSIKDGLAEYEDIVSSLPRLRYLLTQDTTKGWGSNCVRYGASCRYFAHRVLGADVIPMDEAQRNGFPHFDLIGIFNSLDHTTFPLDVIRSSLKLADHVLIVTHRATHAGKQHLYAFSDDFPEWLNKSLGGTLAEDMNIEVDVEGHRDYNIILLTKKAGTHDAV